jgi:hypothetical protein
MLVQPCSAAIDDSNEMVCRRMCCSPIISCINAVAIYFMNYGVPVGDVLLVVLIPQSNGLLVIRTPASSCCSLDSVMIKKTILELALFPFAAKHVDKT